MDGAENIILYNTRIYEEENLSPQEFLKKVNRVKRIRTSKELAFTFFPASKKENDTNLFLWEFVNGNFNALNHQHQKYFIVMLPRWLYLFLRYSSWENVENCIAVALTGLYAAEPDQREKMEKYLERSLFLKVKDYFNTYFSEFENFTFIVAEDWNLADIINDDYFEKRKRFSLAFDYFFRDNCANPIIIPFIYPIFDSRLNKKSAFSQQDFRIPLVNSYFTKSDWKRIVQGESSDELIRIDSEEEPWVNWKKNFLRANRI
jgi:hypothetical protein